MADVCASLLNGPTNGNCNLLQTVKDHVDIITFLKTNVFLNISGNAAE